MRVKYPIEAALNHLVAGGHMSLDSENKYMSVVSQSVAASGAQSCVSAHTVPGRGVPNELMVANNSAAVLPNHLIPSTDEAVQLYRHAGGVLTAPSPFGTDPWQHQADASSARLRILSLVYSDVQPLFESHVNFNPLPFQQYLIRLKEIPEQFA